MIQRSSLHVLLAATTLTLSTTVQAQSGTLDTTFDPGTGVQAGADPHIGAVEVLPDGKILIAGLFSTYNGQAAETLVRLNADGSLDPTFTVLSAWISNSYVFDLAQQPDGKILVGADNNVGDPARVKELTEAAWNEIMIGRAHV